MQKTMKKTVAANDDEDVDAADDDDVGDDDVDVLFCLVGLREKSKTDKSSTRKIKDCRIRR